MTSKLPDRLGRSPLLEATFEMRFGASATAAGDLLPGLLYEAFKSEFPRVERNVMSGVPRSIRDADPNFLYQPSHRLLGDSGAIHVGDHVVGLGSSAYPGWTNFKASIEKLIRSMSGTGMVSKVDRFSFRYINLLPCEPSESQLDLLEANLQIVGESVSETGLQLRFERRNGRFTTVVQILPQTIAKLPSNREIRGILIDVDTLGQVPDKAFMSSPSLDLEEAHKVAKQMFYSLLKPSTIQRLEPQQ